MDVNKLLDTIKKLTVKVAKLEKTTEALDKRVAELEANANPEADCEEEGEGGAEVDE
jgi:cell division protein FtsB